MLTFQSIYELLFHSFRIQSSVSFLDEVESEGIHDAMIIKRSWVYGLFILGYYITILLLLGVWFYFARTDISQLQFLFFLVMSFIALFGLVLHFLFLFRYMKTRNFLNFALKLIKVRSILEKEEKNFSRFFNWITSLYYSSVIITLFSFYTLYSTGGKILVSSTLIGVFIFTVVLIAYYRRKMIDLDMDYIVVVPNQIFFVDQSGVYRKEEVVKWLNNIRLVTSRYPNPLASLLDYGTIEVAVKNDTQAILDKYHMHYVDRPITVVKEIQKIINLINSNAS